MLTDQTSVGGMIWETLKVTAMEDDYREQGWFQNLSESDRRLLEDLRIA